MYSLTQNKVIVQLLSPVHIRMFKGDMMFKRSINKNAILQKSIENPTTPVLIDSDPGSGSH